MRRDMNSAGRSGPLLSSSIYTPVVVPSSDFDSPLGGGNSDDWSQSFVWLSGFLYFHVVAKLTTGQSAVRGCPVLADCSMVPWRSIQGRRSSQRPTRRNGLPRVGPRWAVWRRAPNGPHLVRPVARWPTGCERGGRDSRRRSGGLVASASRLRPAVIGDGVNPQCGTEVTR